MNQTTGYVENTKASKPSDQQNDKENGPNAHLTLQSSTFTPIRTEADISVFRHEYVFSHL